MSTESDRVRIATGLGWTRFDYEMGEGQCFIAPGKAQHISNLVFEKDLPQFETDANASLQICEFMKEKGYETLIEYTLEDGWSCDFDKDSSGIMSNYAETLPAAICAAFCQFLDAEKGDGR